MMGGTVVFLPCLGEFGYFIVKWIRYVHFFEAGRKVVCCREGHQVFFPSADEFIVAPDLIPDCKRRGASCRPWTRNALVRYHASLLSDERMFFCFEYPFVGEEFGKDKLVGNFLLKPKVRGLKVDVVLAPRRRFMGRTAKYNLDLWPGVLARLRGAGLSVGVIGARESSLDLRGDLVSWDFPDDDACIEMMMNARVVVSPNCGMVHLAIFLRRPMVLVHNRSGMGFYMDLQRDMSVPFIPVYIWENGRYRDDADAVVARAVLDYLHG